MKRIASLILLALVIYGISAQAQQDSKPKIKDYIDKEIRIVDSFAGQSITLIKENKDYYIIRKIFGSGVPVVATIRYKVEFNSDYQITFSEIIEDSGSDDNTVPVEKFILSINAQGLNLYLNGLKIVAN